MTDRRANPPTRKFAGKRLADGASEYCTIQELAQAWSVADKTVRKWIRLGALPGVRIGVERSQWRVPRAAAILFAEKNIYKVKPLKPSPDGDRVSPSSAP